MKRTFTLFMLLTVIAAVAFAGKAPVKAIEFNNGSVGIRPLPAELQNAKPWTGDMSKIIAKHAAKKGIKAAPHKAAAADYEGTYSWSTGTANEQGGAFTDTKKNVSFTADNGNISVSFGDLGTATGTIDSETLAQYNVDLITLDWTGTSNYGPYKIYACFYYEGDDENEAGWYNNDPTLLAWDSDNLDFNYLDADPEDIYLVRILTSGVYKGYSLTPYYKGGSLEATDPIVPVEAPEGLEVEEYSVQARNYKDNADVTGSVFIGFDDNDVYIKGFCTALPDAWVKGTLDENNNVTFAVGQYFGDYYGTDLYFNSLVGTDVVFTYDAEADKFIAQDEYFLVDESTGYWDSYRNAILTKVIEKAATPAQPSIDEIESTRYGNVLVYTQPTVDTEGNGLVTSKLFYEIYADVQGEQSLVTFTPSTHVYLAEATSRFPYNFTEDYDFYGGSFYLNGLDADWNKVAIKSIYEGGGESHESMSEWFDIKPYSIEEISINLPADASATLKAGETLQLSVTVAPEGAEGNIEWSSSNEDLATVDENGLVSAVDAQSIVVRRAPADGAEDAEGEQVTITAASASNPDIKGEIALTIIPVVSGVNDIKVNDVVAVKYVNAQGMVSATPFDGINIMVTTLSNGTTKTAKVIK